MLNTLITLSLGPLLAWISFFLFFSLSHNFDNPCPLLVNTNWQVVHSQNYWHPLHKYIIVHLRCLPLSSAVSYTETHSEQAGSSMPSGDLFIFQIQTASCEGYFGVWSHGPILDCLLHVHLVSTYQIMWAEVCTGTVHLLTALLLYLTWYYYLGLDILWNVVIFFKIALFVLLL